MVKDRGREGLRKSWGVGRLYCLINKIVQVARPGSTATAGVQAGNVIFKVKTPSFELITCRMPLLRPTGDAATLSRVAARIIETKLDPLQGARLLGLQTDQLIPIGTGRVYAVPLFAELD